EKIKLKKVNYSVNELIKLIENELPVKCTLIGNQLVLKHYYKGDRVKVNELATKLSENVDGSRITKKKLSKEQPINKEAQRPSELDSINQKHIPIPDSASQLNANSFKSVTNAEIDQDSLVFKHITILNGAQSLDIASKSSMAKDNNTIKENARKEFSFTKLLRLG
ncbi:MAG: hypothetical protein ACKO96_24945, partial [Flammeovirgaceae bacterium]